MKKQLFLQIALFVLLLPGLVGCAALTAPVKSLVADNLVSLPAMTTTASAPLSKNDTLAALEGALEAIYTQVNPSVVSIQVTQKATANAPTMPDFPGFRFFFDPNTPQGDQPQSPQEFYQHGAGSGFVWDKTGHIVTNNHVVEGADKITVRFADGAQAEAKLVGADPDSDLAVLKVDLSADKLPPVRVGDSTQVRVGQLAVAIGNPFSLENTMTVGFVSALGRILPVSSGQDGPAYTIPDIIQTDAPINPGNSGGVLVNDQGEVIGVTAAIESPVRASAGVGFAIPSAIVQKVVPALIKNGTYQHTWLGVSGASLTPDLAKAMNLKTDQRGALVIEVSPGSPADKAGLRGSDRQIKIEDQQAHVGGDVITAMDSQPIKEFDDLVAYLARATEVGQKAKLTILRQGKEETVEVTLAARPKLDQETAQVEKITTGGARLGIQGMSLTPDIAQAMGLSSEQKGVLVQQVETGSPADKAGLNGSYKSARISGRRVPVGGDVIMAIDDQSVTDMADLQSYLQAKSGQKATLTVLREGKEVKVEVTLGE